MSNDLHQREPGPFTRWDIFCFGVTLGLCLGFIFHIVGR